MQNWGLVVLKIVCGVNRPAGCEKSMDVSNQTRRMSRLMNIDT
jgi:hypothetical protein